MNTKHKHIIVDDLIRPDKKKSLVVFTILMQI